MKSKLKSADWEADVMANIYTSVDQLIGRTPLLELTRVEKKYGLKGRLLAKLESFNPAGSVKDRVGKANHLRK